MSTKLPTYTLLDSQCIEEVVADFSRVLDEAVEDKLIDGRFSLDITVEGENFPCPSIKPCKCLEEKFRYSSRQKDPINHRLHLTLFLLSKLRQQAQNSPRGIDRIRISAVDRLTGGAFAADTAA